jgi:hypothetical protein
LGETASSSQVFSKGPVARACWCTLGVNLGSSPVPTQELFEWLDRLVDTQFEIRSRPLVVWMPALIQKVKRVDNAVSREVDHWFDITIGGYITEFAVDKTKLYSQAERYFFKGPRGKFLHFLKMTIKMLLHENHILNIQ